jgi:hypothetical protein
MLSLPCHNTSFLRRQRSGPDWQLFRNRWEVRLFRLLLLKCFKKVVPSFGLRIFRILYFQPAADHGVRSDFPLRHDAFQISANLIEQINPPALNILSQIT